MSNVAIIRPKAL